MILEKVYYLSIDALAHRVAPMEACLTACGVPFTCRERYLGVDGGEYASTEAMLRDSHAPKWLHNFGIMRHGSVAVHWSMFKLFREIASLPIGHCAILLLDDAHLTRPWWEYVHLAHELPDFDVVQLHAFDYRLFVDTEEWCAELAIKAESYAALELCEARSDFHSNTIFPGGHALMVSAEGATKCFQELKRTPIGVLDMSWGGLPLRVFSPVEPSANYWSVVLSGADDSYREKVDRGGQVS